MEFKQITSVFKQLTKTEAYVFNSYEMEFTDEEIEQIKKYKSLKLHEGQINITIEEDNE